MTEEHEEKAKVFDRIKQRKKCLEDVFNKILEIEGAQNSAFGQKEQKFHKTWDKMKEGSTEKNRNKIIQAAGTMAQLAEDLGTYSEELIKEEVESLEKHLKSPSPDKKEVKHRVDDLTLIGREVRYIMRRGPERRYIDYQYDVGQLKEQRDQLKGAGLEYYDRGGNPQEIASKIAEAGERIAESHSQVIKNEIRELEGDIRRLHHLLS